VGSVPPPDHTRSLPIGICHRHINLFISVNFSVNENPMKVQFFFFNTTRGGRAERIALESKVSESSDHVSSVG